jgi:hypothetical protein
LTFSKICTDLPLVVASRQVMLRECYCTSHIHSLSATILEIHMKTHRIRRHGMDYMSKRHVRKNHVAAKHKVAAIFTQNKRVQACSALFVALHARASQVVSLCGHRAEVACKTCSVLIEGWLMRQSDTFLLQLHSIVQRVRSLRMSPSLRIQVGMRWDSDGAWNGC